MAKKMPRSRMTVSVMRATIMTWLSVASRLMKTQMLISHRGTGDEQVAEEGAHGRRECRDHQAAENRQHRQR